MNLRGRTYALVRRAGSWWRYRRLGGSRQVFTAALTPELECDTWELGQFVWRRLVPIVGTSPFPPNELMLMSAAMVWLRPAVIVEWGTNVGASARVFHEVNVRYRIGAQIHSIDLPDSAEHREHPHRRRGLLVRGLPVRLHQGDGPVVAAEVLQSAPWRRPLVFIDGDHARESVLRDGRAVLAAAPQASLLFHDTFYQPSSAYNHGPHEAVREIVAELGGAVRVVESGLGCPGMTLLLPRAWPDAGR